MSYTPKPLQVLRRASRLAFYLKGDMGGVFVRVSGQTASLISFEIERLCPAPFHAIKEGVGKKMDAPSMQVNIGDKPM